MGTAEIIETQNEKIPFLIAAPTMRVPMILQNTVHPYLATRAVLRLVQLEQFASGSLSGEVISSHVRHVAFPGLGTGVGRVGPMTCAHQVREAIDAVLLGKQMFPETWLEAQVRHQSLYTEEFRDLQR